MAEAGVKSESAGHLEPRIMIPAQGPIPQIGGHEAQKTTVTPQSPGLLIPSGPECGLQGV